jgi:dipeptidyl aminopeptidase/acylaminoacyl peptidase
LHAGSDIQPGEYYRFDTKTGDLLRIAKSYPWLDGLALARMKSHSYEARDGAVIPGYLSFPPGEVAGPRPVVVLPHGGPRARDDWGYSWFAQFFASQGYLVLQANYRGSGGYGDAWAGAGAFREWERAISDIDDGLQSLIDKGIVDPTRVCIVGWSYGGYAALLSAAEFPKRYRCVVSIAGVSDPKKLLKDSYGHSRKYVKSQIGWDFEDAGIPRRRAEEIQVPVLLVHGDMDVNVTIDHSKDMRKALQRAKREVELVTYEGTDHNIDFQRHRMDMLRRVGGFLNQHLKESSAAHQPEASLPDGP